LFNYLYVLSNEVNQTLRKALQPHIAQCQNLTQRMTILENMSQCHYFILDTNYEMLINQTYKKLKQHVRYDIICRIT